MFEQDTLEGNIIECIPKYNTLLHN